jgi:dethiobiotin synthetase
LIFAAEPDVGKAVYSDFLPQALKSGQIKPAPPAKVVAHGVEGIQEAVDAHKKGASAVKYVVTL